jgi:hypothetical protein
MITLGSALEALIREHEYCRELDAGVEDDRVWMRRPAQTPRRPETSKQWEPRRQLS